MQFADYWLPAVLSVVSVSLGVIAAVHAAMTKDDVRAAIGWAGVALLSPFLGPLLYAVAGINRIRRTAVQRRKRRSGDAGASLAEDLLQSRVVEVGGPQFQSLRRLGDEISRFPLSDRNRVTLLDGGDEFYPALEEAINGAERSVALETYIFDRDRVGLRIADALIAAVQRGVEVRVIIDGIGLRYSRPSIARYLRQGGVTVGLFLNRILGLRLPYANLRTHRKVAIIDGRIAFTGGMNIREGFAGTLMGDRAARDVHFRAEGPIVGQLFSVFTQDWHFVSGERLGGSGTWAPHAHPTDSEVLARVVQSGPDSNIGSTHGLIMGALAVAQESIAICSPYFLPDRQLVGAFTVAARRGVAVDIIIPAANNLRLVDWGMTAQLDQVIRHGCRVWRSSGPFDHAKLMVVDGAWALVGSSNFDPRSMRLNFELDVEIIDRALAADIRRRIDHQLEHAVPETMATLASRPFLIRLRNRIVWLASPYL